MADIIQMCFSGDGDGGGETGWGGYVQTIGSQGVGSIGVILSGAGSVQQARVGHSLDID